MARMQLSPPSEGDTAYRCSRWVGSSEVDTLRHVRAGEVRETGLSNQEGSASQGSLRPASWWQQWQQQQLQRLHKPDCYLVSTPRAVGENNAHGGRSREVE